MKFSHKLIGLFGVIKLAVIFIFPETSCRLSDRIARNMHSSSNALAYRTQPPANGHGKPDFFFLGGGGSFSRLPQEVIDTAIAIGKSPRHQNYFPYFIILQEHFRNAFMLATAVLQVISCQEIYIYIYTDI